MKCHSAAVTSLSARPGARVWGRPAACRDGRPRRYGDGRAARPGTDVPVRRSALDGGRAGRGAQKLTRDPAGDTGTTRGRGREPAVLPELWRTAGRGQQTAG